MITFCIAGDVARDAQIIAGSVASDDRQSAGDVARNKQVITITLTSNALLIAKHCCNLLIKCVFAMCKLKLSLS